MGECEGPGPGQKEGRRGLMAMRCDDGSRGTHVFCATAADKQSEVRQVRRWGPLCQTGGTLARSL